ncbi:30S ribosomal protein S20 [Seleniivibrio woodruffii]|uniref:Small ribosomal subunit protein bS20 n=1 Tax=Seleniivibrio woodruffii TaxID=1078050 RepID=A0A4R1KBE2_9BACT|nr:30S ribosomal protein S20 [Seleniivibrio woodruffii]TCK60479.1 SSU ribosomal protein S20P [Seleniivibrio woodruffii]TVZ36107.1 SSU ribosomal protein S20P [Seleniivibrio woodruffii]
MAHTISALKRIRQSEKRNLRNKSYKSKMRTMVKKFTAAATTGDAQTAEAAFKTATSTIASIGSKGVIHKNQVARRQSRLAKKLNALKTA